MSGGAPPTDARVFLQAVATTNPGDPIGVSTRLRNVRCNDFGQLWVGLGDPVAGLPVEVELLDTNTLLTGVNNARALMVGAIDLVADPTTGGGQFAQVERGFLNADDLAATRIAQLSSASLSVWNDANAGWDRVRGLNFGDNIGAPGLDVGIVAAAAQIYLGNSVGGLAIGMNSLDTTAASINASSSNWLPTASVQYAFNGSSFNRIGIASAANLAEQSGNRAQLATAPGEWTLSHSPAANTTATATRAAGGAGVRHVLTSINATLIGVAAIAAPISVVVRDGATGVGAILWEDRLFAPAAGSKDRVTLTGLNIVGSANTAMTVEFTAAPGATNFENVAATGYSS